MIAAIWRALEDRDEYGKCVKLLILTDARREEIGGTAASRAQQEWQAAYLAAHAADAVDHRLSPEAGRSRYSVR